jgi:ABC-type proline/glycine betaine transport system ATPase subunit
MPRRIIIDHQKLIKMVEDGVPRTEIMKKFGHSTSAQLKNAYMRALIAEGKVASIKGSRGAGKAVKEKPIVVGKRGSIVIPAEKVVDLGVGKDDKFTIRKTRAGIALKRL